LAFATAEIEHTRRAAIRHRTVTHGREREVERRLVEPSF
jgi:hypothetical protein